MTRRPYISRPSIPEPRAFLLRETLVFVRAAAQCPGVQRIALIGSLTTDKPLPKDTDLLITLEDGVDLDPLATLARRLKGRATSINCGADVFLIDIAGRYIGRICSYRECRPRMACIARNCGARDHLNDDLGDINLPTALTCNPPLNLWPRVETWVDLPADVEMLLAAPLKSTQPRL